VTAAAAPSAAAAVLVMLVPMAGLDKGASFAAAFSYVNMDWARYVVALGALMGIITTTLVSTCRGAGVYHGGQQHVWQRQQQQHCNLLLRKSSGSSSSWLW
jgi:hypothetical protein